MRPDETPTSRLTLPDRRANGSPRAAPRRSRFRRRLCMAWLAVRRWFQTNTARPQWLPAGWGHPCVSYLLAVLIEIGAAGLTLLLLRPLPLFALQGSLLLLGIVVVALTWGAGPSLVATLVGTALLELLVVPPYASRLLHGMADWRSGVVSLLVGCSISLIASQSGQARRHAEALARSLSAEKARSDMERERLRALLEVLPAAVGMVDAQGRFLERNPTHQALWGPASLPGELAQLQGHQGWWPATGQPLAAEDCAIARALTRGETILNEEVEELVEGERKVILHSAAPIRDATGAIRGAAGVLQDITERKRLERELAMRAAQLAAILESIADGLIVTDAQGRLLHLNAAYRTLLGLGSEPKGVTLPMLQELAGHAVLNAEGHSITEAERPVNRILQGEVLTGLKHVDLLLRTRAGYEVQVNVSGAPIRDTAGHLLGTVQVLRDVTEQRRMEQHTRDTLDALLAMAETLVQTPDQAPAAGTAVGSEIYPAVRRLAELTRRVLGCQQVSIVAVEPATAAMTPLTLVGLAPADEQQWWADLEAHPRLSQRLHPEMVAALQAGEPVLLESRQPTLPIWQHLTPQCASWLVPMRIGETLVGLLRVDGEAQGEADADAHWQALLRAVTRLGALVLERERLRREWEEARASELALRKTNAQMDTFLGMAGHELKTPLTSIKLALQLIQRRIQCLLLREREGANDLAPVLKQVARTEQQADRLDRLVNDLLDVSRVRAGKLELHLDTANLAAIVCEAVEEQRQAHPERVLLLHVPADLAVPVLVDGDRIGQVVTNYLTNALKYSPADRSVEVGLDVEAEQARVWVRDQGPGLPPEEQERIWERFHRVQGIAVQSGTGVGLGLGLHICHTIIERHQGQVGVESVPGQGSTFWFTLPLAPVKER